MVSTDNWSVDVDGSVLIVNGYYSIHVFLFLSDLESI